MPADVTSLRCTLFAQSDNERMLLTRRNNLIIVARKLNLSGNWDCPGDAIILILEQPISYIQFVVVVIIITVKRYGDLMATSRLVSFMTFNPLTPTVAMRTAIKHPVPDRVKPSFVIFAIRALWRSGLSVRVPGCQKLQVTT